ncbi:MAG: tyrosine-protein phosphatase [Lachnospiraceae bacterium]|nr:tyrosine-protein phosphatase [Lachnospiraceae bacterium]
MTAIVKVLKKSAAIFLTMTLLMSGFSLNVVNAADKGRSSGGSLSANGSQTKDEGQTADKNQAADRNQTAGKSQAEIDEARGNFRNVHAGRIGRNNLFRSQHPGNGTWRALRANQLAEENGIRTVLNLSDSKTKLEKYLNKYIVGSSYYYKTLYKRGRVFTAGLSLTHKSPSYRHQVAAAFRFMTKNKGPYLVHCEVGRDRTGLVILLLESLMGVPYGYMVNDYAQTYLNTTYDSPATAKQKAASHVNSELMYISGQKSITDWSKVNLNRYAVLYLKMGGMTDSEISLLRKNLSVSYPAREVTFESIIKK